MDVDTFAVRPLEDESTTQQTSWLPLRKTLLRELGFSVVKNPLVNAGDIKDVVQSLGQEDPLEEGMAAHSSVLAWRIPWTEETGGYSPQCRTELNTTAVT